MTEFGGLDSRVSSGDVGLSMESIRPGSKGCLDREGLYIVGFDQRTKDVLVEELDVCGESRYFELRKREGYTPRPLFSTGMRQVYKTQRDKPSHVYGARDEELCLVAHPPELGAAVADADLDFITLNEIGQEVVWILDMDAILDIQMPMPEEVDRFALPDKRLSERRFEDQPELVNFLRMRYC